jgi:hypothetical protein
MSDTKPGRRLAWLVPALFFGCALACRAQNLLAPPGSLQVLEAGLRKVTLSWVPSPDPAVSGYVVYRQDGPDKDFREVGTVRGWQSSRFVDEGRLLRRLKDQAEYLYCVAAFTDEGRVSVPTSIVRARTRGAPAAVLGLQAKAGPRRIVLSWSPSPELEVSGYRIWRSKERDAEYRRVGTRYRREQASFTDRGLEDLQGYFYMVTAVNAVGLESEPCQPVSVRTLAPPLTPIGVTAPSNARDRVELSWEPNPEPNLSHYEILRSSKADRGYKIIGRAGPREPRFVDVRIQAGTLYFYSVVAVDFNGLRSQPSPPVRAFSRSPPLAPVGLGAQIQVDGVLLSWQLSTDPNVAGYLVYQKRRYHWEVVARTRQASVSVGPLAPDLVHKFRVSAHLANGLESEPSEILKLQLDPASEAGADFASVRP